jgi:hypothetical protein
MSTRLGSRVRSRRVLEILFEMIECGIHVLIILTFSLSRNETALRRLVRLTYERNCGRESLNTNLIRISYYLIYSWKYLLERIMICYVIWFQQMFDKVTLRIYIKVCAFAYMIADSEYKNYDLFIVFVNLVKWLYYWQNSSSLYHYW